MRTSRKLLASVLFLTSLLQVAPAKAFEIPATFSLQGSGYGHGVGMSQMGARSMELAGQTPTSILQYFYKDVVIEQVDDSKILRVNIGLS